MRTLSRPRSRIVIVSICFLVALCAPSLRQLIVKADGTPVLIGNAPVHAIINEATSLAQVQITGEDGGDTVPMRLSVNHGSLSFGSTTGLTFDGSNSGSLVSFNGTVDDINAALATLQYTGGQLGGATLDVSLTNANQVYDPANGHLYEYVYSTSPGHEEDGINWADAKTQADAMTMGGLTGYLATITSADENNYVASKLPDAGWMGASDAVTEGQWKWVDGPESGTLFYTGNAADETGVAVPGQYNAWNGGEPNNSGGESSGDSGEDCGQYLSGSSGAWNDLPCHNAYLPGFVVEFGDSTHHVNITSESVDINVTGQTTNVATCTQLQNLAGGNQYTHIYDTINLTADIDCSGVDFQPLFDDSSFAGTFDGHGHTISHLTINQPSNFWVGFIDYAEGATIQNITFDTGSVTGEGEVGGVVANATNLTLTDVASNMDVTSSYGEVGGLVSQYSATGVTIVNSGLSSTGTVRGASYGGGLVGYVTVGDGADVTFEHSFATGAITYAYYAPEGSTGYAFGGLFGQAEAYVDSGGNGKLTIQDTYATGAITATDHDHDAASPAGGLVGTVRVNNYTSSDTATIIIRRSYASGAVAGHADVGGLVGTTWAQAGTMHGAVLDVENNFAVGALSADPETRLGGLFGYVASDGNDDSTFAGNYYDVHRTGAGTFCDGNDALTTCTGVNADGTDANYFKNNHIHAPLNAWNFSGVWVQHGTAYPTFSVLNDNDGVSVDTENAAPNSGDGNNDGIPDSDESNVTSTVGSETGKYLTLEVPDGCNLSTVSTASETADAVLDGAYNYPAGLLNYAASCGTPGYVATVNIYVYGVTGNKYVLRKYNPTTRTYSTITNATFTPVTVGGQAATEVSYQITDGGPYDLDGSANGTIVDPVGLAVTANAGTLSNTGINLLLPAGAALAMLLVAIRVQRGTRRY